MLFFSLTFITYCVKKVFSFTTRHSVDSTDTSSSSSYSLDPSPHNQSTCADSMATSVETYNTEKHSVSFADEGDHHLNNGHHSEHVEITHTPATPTSASLDEPVAAKRQSGGAGDDAGADTAEDFIKYEERNLIERLSQMMDKEFETQGSLASSHPPVPEPAHHEQHRDEHEVSSNASSDHEVHVVTAETHEPDHHHHQQHVEVEEHHHHHHEPQHTDADEHHHQHHESSVDDFLEQLNERVEHREPDEYQVHHQSHHEENHHKEREVEEEEEEEEKYHSVSEDNHVSAQSYTTVETTHTSHETVVQRTGSHEYQRTDSQSSFTIGTYHKTNGDRNNNPRHSSTGADEAEEAEDEFNEFAGFKNKVKMWSNNGVVGAGSGGDGDQPMSSAEKFKTLKQIKRGNTRSLMERFQIQK